MVGKLLPWLSWYFSFLVILASACSFLLILLHGFLSYKILFFIWFHLIPLHLTFFHILKSIYTLKSLLVLKLLVFCCLFSGFYHRLMGLSNSSFVKVNFLSYHFSFLLLPTLHSVNVLLLHIVITTCNYYVITISVFIDHLCCTSIVVNVCNANLPNNSEKLKLCVYFIL